jgi:asparagine synthetase B (glutamine-hydrolysing)
MGGIFGFISSSPVSEKDTSIVEEMNRTLVQRGPDSSGIYRDSNLALARRRLKGIYRDSNLALSMRRLKGYRPGG